MMLMEMADSTYHGIIVQESLTETSILDSVRILSRKKGETWTLLKVEMEESNSGSFLENLQHKLKDNEAGVPYYSHFYRSGELIVIFPGRIFHMTLEKGTWADATSYGTSRGIPPEQLDFYPYKEEQEEF